MWDFKPYKGSVKINGTIAPLIELGAGFDMDLTARENIFLNGAVLGYDKEFMKQHFDEIVEFAELKDFLDMPIKIILPVWQRDLDLLLRLS